MMENINNYKGHKMFDALIELNEELIKHDKESIELNVIGGFALAVYGYRDLDTKTDIDYAGESLDREVEDISDKIGLKHHLGRGWINNDCMFTSLEDMELSTGKLHFIEAFKLEKIKINLVDPEDLLRLKVIAVDTQLCSIDKDVYEVTRYKDFEDLKRLMEKQNVTIKDLEDNPEKYHIVNKYTPTLMNVYITQGREALKDEVYRLSLQSLKRYNMVKNDYEESAYEGSKYINQMLQNAFSRYSKELIDR